MSEQAAETTTAAPTTPATGVTDTTTAPVTTATVEPPKEAAKVDPFHKAWSSLASKEKTLINQQKSMAESAKRMAAIDAAYALGDTDPLAAIEKLGELYGKTNLFELAAEKAVSRKKSDPQVTKAMSEIDVLRNDLTMERAAPLLGQGLDVEAIAEQLGVEPEALNKVFRDKRYSARVEKAQADYNQQIENTLSKHAQATAEWVLSVKDADGVTPKYELISALEASDKVFELISRHFEETLALGNPVQLTNEQAADIIEHELSLYAAKLAGVKKLQPKPVETPKAVSKQTTTPKKTLSNVLSQESGTVEKPMSEKDRLNAAIKIAEQLGRK